MDEMAQCWNSSFRSNGFPSGMLDLICLPVKQPPFDEAAFFLSDQMTACWPFELSRHFPSRNIK
jgi:hypothetical protein